MVDAIRTENSIRAYVPETVEIRDPVLNGRVEDWRTIEYDNNGAPVANSEQQNIRGLPMVTRKKSSITNFVESIIGGLTRAAGSAASPMVQNEFMSRAFFYQHALDKCGQDLYQECGYPEMITPRMYRAMFDREGAARRLNDVLPEEMWALPPEIFDDEDEQNITEFEKAFMRLDKKRKLIHYMERLDKNAGLGTFAILLIGINDGKKLDQPAAGIDEDGEMTEARPEGVEVNYYAVYDESMVQISKWNIDENSARYNMPTEYMIRLQDSSTIPFAQTIPASRTLRVHWTRVIHDADNLVSSEVFGMPRLQQSFNRLLDLRKIYGGAGEMLWKGGFPGIAFEVDPEYTDAQIDIETTKEDIKKYSRGLERYILLNGIKATNLNVQLASPKDHIEANLRALALEKGIPWRIFCGSEEAKLAGDSDSDSWNKRLNRRQDKRGTPQIVRPVIDRHVALGCLPVPANSEVFDEPDYQVVWPDLNDPDDAGKADIIAKITTAFAAYTQSGIESWFPPFEFLTIVCGFPPELVRTVLAAGIKHAQEHELDDAGDPTTDNPEQPHAGKQVGAPKPPDPVEQAAAIAAAKAGAKPPIPAK